MIVFDVDGTLIGGEATDWASFDAAFEEVAGFALDEPFLQSIGEITAQAIVHQALAGLSLDERRSKERQVRDGYLRRLIKAQHSDPSTFTACEGVHDLLCDLKEKGVSVAIATGDWRETILFKMQAAGIRFDEFPIVTSSDFYSRADIISASVARSGRKLAEAIYVGDGLWDLRATKKLGIPFIGVGLKSEKLIGAGASHIALNLSPNEFWRIRNAMISEQD
jgi:phosphoglycolate phosphatase-like HAD superfamily hydrolase